VSVCLSLVGAIKMAKYIKLVCGTEANLSLSYCAVRELGYLKNKGTSVWNLAQLSCLF